MIVGATLLIVSIGTGAPARIDSSKNTNCSIAERPWPPYSSGQPMPAQPSAHICFQTRAHRPADAAATRVSSATVSGSSSFS